MLADAIRSEAYRFSKNRLTVFWSTMFVPIAGLVIAVGTFFFMKAREAELVGKMPPEIANLTSGGPLDLGVSLADSAGDLANPLTLLFLLIGAATVYAGDYRWESWRLTSARNTRPNLLLGKLVVVTGLALLGMVAWLVSGFVSDLIKAAIFDRPLSFSFSDETAANLFGLTGLAWLRIVQFAMVSLLAAVMTRSLLAALFVPLVVAVGQFFTMQSLPLLGLEPQDWISQLLLPGMGYDMLKVLIEGGPTAGGMPDGVAIKAWISLVLWTALPLAGAIAWFRRQDLSKE